MVLAEIWVARHVSYFRQEKSFCHIFHMQSTVSLTAFLSPFPYFSHNAHLYMPFISRDIMVMCFILSFIANHRDKQTLVLSDYIFNRSLVKSMAVSVILFGKSFPMHNFFLKWLFEKTRSISKLLFYVYCIYKSQFYSSLTYNWFLVCGV